MSSTLMSLGMLNPWALLLGIPVLGALVYAYLRKQKLVPVIVPTLFLLRDLAKPVSTRRKFFPPLRFWFELALLSLLLLCFAGIFYRTTAERYALLVDNSLSTAAFSGNERLIDNIRKEVDRTLATLRSEAVFDVYRTSPRLERIGRSDMERAEVMGTLRDLEPSYAAENFDDLISQTMQRGQYARLIVFSDHRLELPSSAAEARKFISLHGIEGKASPLQNLSLSDIALERNTTTTFVARVALTSFSSAAQSVELVLERLIGAGMDARWEKIGGKTVATVPTQAVSVALSLEDAEKLSAVRVRIDPRSVTPEVDALPDDNQIYLSLKRESARVRVVSSRSIADLGIDKIRGISFEAVSLKEFEQRIAQDDSASYLFVDFVPDGLPDKNLVIVSPPSGSGGFEVRPVVNGGELTEWKSGHPLLTYIDTATIKLSRFVPLVAPLWAESIISTARGSAMLAGERGGKRVVVAGFDLFPYRGRSAPMLSVLFLNMLRWVSADPLGSRPFQTYEPVPIAPDISGITRLGEEDSPEVFPYDAGAASFVGSMPALYMVQGAGAEYSVHAVNFSSPHESNLNPAVEVLSAVPSAPANEKLETSRQLTDLATPLILALLALDLFYLLFRSLKAARTGRWTRRSAVS